MSAASRVAGSVRDGNANAAGSRGPASPMATPVVLSLPAIHCHSCISGVERALSAAPGVLDARVNLTRKRVTVRAAPGTGAEDLVAALGRAGFEAREMDRDRLGADDGDSLGRGLLLRLAVAGFASMNVMLLSVSVWSGAPGATRDLFHWISAAIALPAVAYAGLPFFAGAWRALRARRLDMDVPIALALALALATSLWETALSGPHAYFEAATMLTAFLLAGRYLDHRARSAARSAARELAALESPRARVIRDGREVEVQASELRVGDRLLVRAGERVPADGVIVAGRGELDRSLVTGESAPVPAEPGQAVSAGETSLSGPLEIRAEAVGRDTSLARMAELVAVAENGRTRYSPLADAAVRLYAPGVHVLAGLSFLGWFLGTGDPRHALNVAAAVLIITCPCALGLAVPAVTAAAAGTLFRKGLLVKHPTALERLSEIDTVVLDKTGTLTAGLPSPVDGDWTDDDLSVAAALASGSSHPLSRALAGLARERGIAPAAVSGLREEPGFGAEAEWRGERARLGRAGWAGGVLPSASRASCASGRTAAWLAIGDHPARLFEFEESLRAGAGEAVRALAGAGLDARIVSGDAPGPVERMARALGVDDWTADARPEDKARLVSNLAESGRKPLMVGDGLNDTLALAVAHASISPGTGLDAARAASDLVLLGDDLRLVPEALAVARRAMRRIRENLGVATVYNALAIPLAVAGLATPLIAALAMSASSVTVSLNAMRVR